MSEHRYGVHDCPNGYYYLRDVTDHSVYVHRNYGKLFSEYEEDIELVSSLLNELADKVDERQDTINKLKKENEQLREINKELGDDLYNCRVNKNIISKILKLWENTLAEYDIYTIKDFTESFELDAKINKEKDEKIKELQVEVLNLELEKEELMRNE